MPLSRRCVSLLAPSFPSSLCPLCVCSIVVYGSVDVAAQCLLTLGPDPEGCPVLCLKHCPQRLFAALQSGTVLVYARSSSGKAPLSSCSLEAAVFYLFSVFRLKSGPQILLNTSHLMTFQAILVACSLRCMLALSIISHVDPRLSKYTVLRGGLLRFCAGLIIRKE